MQTVMFAVLPVLLVVLPASRAHSATYGYSHERGSLTVHGTSLGAFTIINGYFAAGGNVIVGDSNDFATVLSVDKSWADFSLTSGTATFSYTSGTDAGSNPFQLTLWIPDPTNGTEPEKLVFGDLASASLTFTYLADSIRFSGGITATDPYTDALISLTITGVMSPDTASYSLAMREPDVLVVSKITSVPEPPAAALLPVMGVAGTAAFVTGRRRAKRRTGGLPG